MYTWCSQPCIPGGHWQALWPATQHIPSLGLMLLHTHLAAQLAGIHTW
jgi:hypothetical protein